MLKQYGRWNNIEIIGIPDIVQDNELENKVIEIFDAISVEAKSADFEDCDRVGKSKNNSKKVIARFANRKVVKNAGYKRKQLKIIDETSIGIQKATIFLNENWSMMKQYQRHILRMENILYVAIYLKMGSTRNFITFFA